jgi:hypothetical protein
MWQPRISPVSGSAEDLDETVVVLDRRAPGGLVVLVRGDHVAHPALTRLSFEESHAADLRRAEHGVRDGVVVDRLGVIGMEDVVGHVRGLQIGAVLEHVFADPDDDEVERVGGGIRGVGST